MVALIHDPALERRLIAHRRRTGADRYDEVWEGVYVVAPLANDEHQDFVGDLTGILKITVQWPGLGLVRPGVNVSDRRKSWKKNYRCPDVAVFLPGTKAENRGSHWFGGPDLAIEIVSPGDRTLEKLPFHEKVGTRELLVVDRVPWGLTLYRLADGRLQDVGRSTPAEARVLTSEVVPLVWQMQSEQGSPVIRVAHRDGRQEWLLRADVETPQTPEPDGLER